MEIKYIIVHHEAPPTIVNGDRFNIVDQYHKSLGWKGIGYQWFIEKSGQKKQGRKEGETGAHTIGHNDDSIGICLAGNFDLELPTENQIKSLISLVKEKMTQYGIPIEKVVPHRFYATYSLAKQGVQAPNTSKWATWDNTQPYKSCWGSKLPDSWIKDLLTSNNQDTKEKISEILIKMASNLNSLAEQVKKL